MSRVVVALLLLVLGGVAHAGERIALADRDPELQRALTASLAPWKAEVIVVDDRETTEARFVVWRESDELVVRDRERGTIERRASHGGPLDPVAAAAAALTVKTMLNLPPIEGVDGPPVVPPPASGPQVSLEVDGVGRVAGGDPGTRARVAVFLKPTSLGLHAGIAGEIGTSSDVDESGFTGTWSDWSVRAIAGWAFDRGAWTIEPRATIGLVRSSLDGKQMSDPRHEAASLFAVGLGIAGWRRIDPFRVGVVVGLEWMASTPTYTRMNMGMGMGMSTVFEVPGFIGSVGVAAAIDFDL